MLEIKRTAIPLEERELLELERILADGDEKSAGKFVKKSIYDKILRAQQSQ